MDNQPFNELPWQYSPNPKIDHRPPIFIYGFALSNDLSEIEHMAHAFGILKLEEPLTGTNLMGIMRQTLDRVENECGLSPRGTISFTGCHCRTAMFALRLKSNYSTKNIPPEELEHVVDILRKYLPGEPSPQWFLDPDVLELRRRSFEIPGSSAEPSSY